MNHDLKGYFIKTYGPLEGSDWLKSLPPEERQALSHIAFAASGYGRNGGQARASGPRCQRCGRFASDSDLIDGEHQDRVACDKARQEARERWMKLQEQN